MQFLPFFTPLPQKHYLQYLKYKEKNSSPKGDSQSIELMTLRVSEQPLWWPKRGFSIDCSPKTKKAHHYTMVGFFCAIYINTVSVISHTKEKYQFGTLPQPVISHITDASNLGALRKLTLFAVHAESLQAIIEHLNMLDKNS